MLNLILGTANFSSNYGVIEKKVESFDLEKLVNFAQENGINHFDTAKAYKGVEVKLGKYLDKSYSIEVDSKISSKDCKSPGSIVVAVEESIHNIGIRNLSTLYLHQHDLLAGNDSKVVITGLEKVLELGLANYLGASVYTQEDLLLCKKIFPSLTRFQILENICDRRLINSPEMMKISESGNQINVRSIFLQGLLLSKPIDIPSNLEGARNALNKLNMYSRNHKIPKLYLCIAYAKSIKWAKKIVIGVDSLDQLREILSSRYELPKDWELEVPILPRDLIDPRFWLK